MSRREILFGPCAILLAVYARGDGIDSGGIQDEILYLNAKEEVVFRRKLQCEKKQINSAS